MWVDVGDGSGEDIGVMEEGRLGQKEEDDTTGLEDDDSTGSEEEECSVELEAGYKPPAEKRGAGGEGKGYTSRRERKEKAEQGKNKEEVRRARQAKAREWMEAAQSTPPVTADWDGLMPRRVGALRGAPHRGFDDSDSDASDGDDDCDDDDDDADADSEPVLGMPIRLHYRDVLPPIYRGFLSAFPEIYVFMTAAGVMAFAAVILYLTSSNSTFYEAPMHVALFCGSGALLTWVACRTIIQYSYYALQRTFYTHAWFYTLERTASDVTAMVWALICFGVANWMLDSNAFLALVEAATTTIGCVYLAHLLKNGIERMYLFHMHMDLYGEDLKRHVADEEVVCVLRAPVKSAPRNTSTRVAADAYQAPTPQTHTHDVERTMRALLGDAIDDKLFDYTREQKRKAAAVRAADIMRNLDPESRGFFTLKQVVASPPIKSKKAAYRAIATFAASRRTNLKSVEVTFDDVANAVFSIFEERMHFYKTLDAIGQISNVLHRATGILFWICAAVAVAVVFQGLEFIFDLLIPLGTFFLGLSFFFGAAAQAAFSSFLLIFVRRPFAHGDRIHLPRATGFPDLVVDKIELMQTECHSLDGKIYILPNTFLANEVIISHYRSTTYAMTIKHDVMADLSLDLVDEIEDRILEFCKTNRDAPWDWSNCLVWIDTVEDSNKAELKVWLGLQGVSWKEPGRYLQAKSYLNIAVQRIIVDLGLCYQGYRIRTVPDMEEDMEEEKKNQ